MREIGKMAIISAESPVSICMYTTINAPIGISSCDFSDDSNLIALGLSDSSIILNSMDPMNKMKKLRDMEYLEKIDIETADNVQSQMFDLQGSTTSVRYTGHGGPVFSVNFSPDRRLLLSSSGDRTIRLWSMDTQRNVVIYRTPALIWDVSFILTKFSQGVSFCRLNSVIAATTSRLPALTKPLLCGPQIACTPSAYLQIRMETSAASIFIRTATTSPEVQKIVTYESGTS